MYGPGGPTGIPETLDVRSSLDYDSNVYHVLTLYCPGPDTQFETMAEEDVEEMEKEQVRSDADLLQKKSSSRHESLTEFRRTMCGNGVHSNDSIHQ